MNKKQSNLPFPQAHLWLLIPFVISVSGFYFTYWSKFTEVPFRQHVHGLTSTAWYLLLILQPWLIHNKSVSYHRKFGFVALFLAGGVVFSALQVMPYQVVSTAPHMIPVLRYGFSFADFAVLSGFSFSVIMAMLNARDTPNHARWMISTAFWALLPAFGRLVFFTTLVSNGGKPLTSFLSIVFICLGIMMIPLLIMIYLDYKNESKVYSPYLFALIGIPIVIALVPVFGTTEWWINWCDNVLGKGM